MSSGNNEPRTLNNKEQSQNTHLEQQQQESEPQTATINLTDTHEMHAPRKVTVNLSGNYLITITRKGNTRLSIDENSLSGNLVLDGNTDREIKIPLTIRNFKVSKNLKKISYKADMEDENLSGRITGQLRLQNPIDTINMDNQSTTPKEESFLSVKLKTPVSKIREESNNRITISQSGDTGM